MIIMIGNVEILKDIQKKLKEIAHLNKQEYGHILDMTDIASTNILLGTLKYNPDEQVRRTARFDIIFGDIYDADNSRIDLHNYYFELSNRFEKDMEEKIKELEKALDEVTFIEKATIRRLDQILENMDGSIEPVNG